MKIGNVPNGINRVRNTRLPISDTIFGISSIKYSLELHFML